MTDDGGTSPIALPNSEQFVLQNEAGQEYLIQISWPLHWQDDHMTRTESMPILYLVDGNALFLTATEAAWRRAASSHFVGGGIVVAIGYPCVGKLYDAKRRSYDLTPPTAVRPPGYGGADEFLNFIEVKVRPAVRARFPKATCSREAIYGHSYGGLLALHALFTRPTAFAGYMASSPSIWWNSRCILREAEAFLRLKQTASNGENDWSPRSQPLPSLLLFFGGNEQFPPQWPNEPLDHYEARKQIAGDLRMEDNVHDLIMMLKGSDRLHAVTLHPYEGEEHTSVMACSMSRSLTEFFEDWPPIQSTDE